MIIRSLKLKNFRNYDSLELDFSPKTNIFFGRNAQGKTNILESIYVAGTTKSHRSSKDKELIKIGEEEAHIELIADRRNLVCDIDMHIKRNQAKGVAINKNPIRKAGDLFGVVNLVFFSPENLNIIKNAPSERRRFIDMELCQLDKVYLNDLFSYNRALMQRNQLLKDLGLIDKRRDKDKYEASYMALDIWDKKLAEYGNKIINRRNVFVQNLNEIVYNIHRRLTGNLEELRIIYCPNTGDLPMEDALLMCKERDLKFFNTSVGPQRDDLIFKVNGMDIRSFGSQGQQRTAALSLKLAEIELVRNTINESPILLLDDVLSELDKNRQEYLLESISDIQTMITCTGLDDFVSNRFHLDQVYEVDNGKVFPIN